MENLVSCYYKSMELMTDFACPINAMELHWFWDCCELGMSKGKEVVMGININLRMGNVIVNTAYKKYD